MGLNCGAKCAKYVLFVFNIIFFSGGAAVLGVGIWVRVDTGSIYDFLKKVDPSGQTGTVAQNVLSDNLAYIHAVAYVLIGIGAFVFLVGFLGCCGAIKQWRPLLVTYAICLIVIMGVEIGVGVAVGVYKDKVIAEVQKQVTPWTHNYNFVATTVQNGILVPTPNSFKNDSAALVQTNAWNAMQIYFECCGASNYTDFLNGSPYATSDAGKEQQAPAFCCKFSDKPNLKLEDPKCGENNGNRPPAPSPVNSNRDTGCITRIKTFVEKHAPAVIGVAVGIGLIELVGIIFAFCLCCAVGDKSRRYN